MTVIFKIKLVQHRVMPSGIDIALIALLQYADKAKLFKLL